MSPLPCLPKPKYSLNIILPLNQLSDTVSMYLIYRYIKSVSDAIVSACRTMTRQGKPMTTRRQFLTQFGHSCGRDAFLRGAAASKQRNPDRLDLPGTGRFAGLAFTRMNCSSFGTSWAKSGLRPCNKSSRIACMRPGLHSSRASGPRGQAFPIGRAIRRESDQL